MPRTMRPTLARSSPEHRSSQVFQRSCDPSSLCALGDDFPQSRDNRPSCATVCMATVAGFDGGHPGIDLGQRNQRSSLQDRRGDGITHSDTHGAHPRSWLATRGSGSTRSGAPVSQGMVTVVSAPPTPLAVSYWWLPRTRPTDDNGVCCLRCGVPCPIRWNLVRELFFVIVFLKLAASRRNSGVAAIVRNNRWLRQAKASLRIMWC